MDPLLDLHIVIGFPGSALQVQGVKTTFDQPTEIRLGLLEIANRLRNLLEADIDIPSTVDTGKHLLVVSFRRRNAAWRNLRAILGDATHFGSFLVPEVLCWDIKVDIVGLVQHSAQAEIALVECKLTAINLSHLSQAIGYSKVVIPRWSLLISPRGVNPSLRRLLSAYNRQDILVYTDTSGRTKR